jgi:hypothetical protein
MTNPEQAAVYINQPCRGCGETYAVKKTEASWRDLCRFCYDARRDAPLCCIDCGDEIDRAYAICGLCVRCFTRAAIQDAAEKTKKPRQPAPRLATFRYRRRTPAMIQARLRTYPAEPAPQRPRLMQRTLNAS